jgi:hypothetical protein
LLQKDDAPEQNENTIASRYNGNPTPFSKSNKNSGNDAQEMVAFEVSSGDNFVS